MRQSAVEILRRWMALDKQLNQRGCGDGVHPATFAKVWNVTPKTINRDLAAFKELGCEIGHFMSPDEPNKWHYVPRTLPLFTKNIRLKIVSKASKAQ